MLRVKTKSKSKQTLSTLVNKNLEYNNDEGPVRLQHQGTPKLISHFTGCRRGFPLDQCYQEN